MARVFISYKRADKENVFPLKDKIETAIGEPCWIDMDGIESDAQFAEVIMHLELLWAGGDAPNDPHKIGSIYRRDNYYPESQYPFRISSRRLAQTSSMARIMTIFCAP